MPLERETTTTPLPCSFLRIEWSRARPALGLGGIIISIGTARHSCVLQSKIPPRTLQHQRFRSEENGYFSEAQSQLLFLQLMQAVEYMHLGIPSVIDGSFQMGEMSLLFTSKGSTLASDKLRWRPTSHFFNPKEGETPFHRMKGSNFKRRTHTKANSTFRSCGFAIRFSRSARVL